ncbi:MAG: hypothetical protein ABL997_03725 [Planctomycetota bacterium]
MKDPRAQNLWFLAPGLSHLLGNALFTVQGRARLLAMATADGSSDPEQVGEDVRAVLDGSARAMVSLSVLRWLLGEGKPSAAACGVVVRELVDVARVPLRDHAMSLELTFVDCREQDEVDPNDLAYAWTSVLRLLCGLPHGEPLRIDVQVRGSEQAVRLDVRCCLAERDTATARPLGLLYDAFAREQDASPSALANVRVAINESLDMLILSLPVLRPSFSPS